MYESSATGAAHGSSCSGHCTIVELQLYSRGRRPMPSILPGSPRVSRSSRASARIATACTSARGRGGWKARSRARACPMDGSARCGQVSSKTRPRAQSGRPPRRRRPSRSADGGSGVRAAGKGCSDRAQSVRDRRRAAAQQFRARAERPKSAELPSPIVKFQMWSRPVFNSATARQAK